MLHRHAIYFIIYLRFAMSDTDQSITPVDSTAQAAPSLLGLPGAISTQPDNPITDLVPTMAPRPTNFKQNPLKRGRTEDGSSSPSYKVIFHANL
jgi:hypothetical protein